MKIRKSLSEKTFDLFNAVFMIALCLTIVFPFWQQIVISFSPPGEANKIGLHLFPESPTMDAYKRIFAGGTILKAYFWTILRTVLGTFLTLLVTAMMAYPLSKKGFYGRPLWMGLVVFTMFFSGGLVPTFLLVRDLHLTNTIWALVLPGLCSAWNILIIRNFFVSIPEEVEESAKIDGANDMYVFYKIIIPLSTPVLATVALWTMVFHWNSWFDALIYNTNGQIKVLQMLLREVLQDANMMTDTSVLLDLASEGSHYTPESVKAAILMLVVTPILFVYPFLQKYFVKGIMIGAVKG
ncbi:carbohydrate ABC transporter permease [Paenibacillus macerans]|uniref:carbohydrate ABC transporter permease n=1 Tax=Paenibacillus macerans TaxID=44252 RepID=UPI003D311245